MSFEGAESRFNGRGVRPVCQYANCGDTVASITRRSRGVDVVCSSRLRLYVMYWIHETIVDTRVPGMKLCSNTNLRPSDMNQRMITRITTCLLLQWISRIIGTTISLYAGDSMLGAGESDDILIGESLQSLPLP